MTELKGGIDSPTNLKGFISQMTASQPDSESYRYLVSDNPERQPYPSPQVGGLRPPHDTPFPRPLSPLNVPSPHEDHTEHNLEVGGALQNFVKNLKGRPLEDSFWAPGGSGYRASPLSESRPPSQPSSRNLMSTRLVTPGPATNDSFERMSFKAADHDNKVGVNIFGDHLTRSTRSVSATLQSKKSPAASSPSTVATTPPHLRNTSSAKYLPVEPTALREKTNSPLPSGDNASSKNDLVLPHIRTTKSSGALGEDQFALLKSLTGFVPKPNANQSTNGATPRLVTNASAPTEEAEKLPAVKEEKSATEGSAVKTTAVIQTRESLEGQLHDKIRELHELDGTYASEHSLLSKSISDLQETIYSKQKVSDELKSSTDKKRASLEKTIADIGAELSRTREKKAKPKAPTLILAPSDQSAQHSNQSNLKTTVSPLPKQIAKDDEDREHKAIFNHWPELQKRDRAPAQFRKVIIRDLPRNCTHSFIAALVYGGPLEQIHVISETTASVKFLHPADCTKYYEATSNGLVYKKDLQGRELAVFVELAKDVDVIGGLLQSWIDTGVTRCVRAVGVDEEWDMATLVKLASGKGRILAGISDEKLPSGSRCVIFRFAKIEDAQRFRGQLARDDDWEQCNITFATDPCEKATGVHFAT